MDSSDLAWVVPVGLTIVVLLIGVGRWAGNIAATLKHQKENTAADHTVLMKLVDDIHRDIQQILQRVPLKSTNQGSPLRLTNVGKEISEELCIRKWADRHRYGLVDAVSDKTHYGVQVCCFEYVQEDSTFTDEEQVAIDGAAYERGIPRQQVLDVYAVELRDTLLELLT